MSITVPPESNLNLVLAGHKFKKVVLTPGNYYLTDILTIDWDNFTLIGKGRSNQIHIYQKNEERDGISIKANNIKIKNVSIHVVHSRRVALVVASSNSTSVTNCHFYGNEDYFTVFYAGPSHLTAGVETLQAYRDHQLDEKNIFAKNVVYTNFSGDSVSWSLQKDSIFQQNIIRGGKLAVYMCRNSVIERNHIYDSSSQGIFISMPSHNLSVNHNDFYHCEHAGITVKEQTEHVDPSGGFDSIKGGNVVISYNTIYDNNHIGIEVNDSTDILIKNNKFLHNEFRAIYLLNCSKIVIDQNIFSYFLISIELINIKQTLITNNKFLTVHPQITERALAMHQIDGEVNSDNLISDNSFYGRITVPIHDPDPNDTNVISNNSHEDFYDYRQEKLIIKLLR